MKLRTCVIGTAICATPLAFGAGTALAAAATQKAATRKVTCKTNIGISVAAGDTAVTPPVSQGAEYGTARCGKQDGVQADRFTVPDSGDTVTRFTWYLASGTIRGRYDLTPQESSLQFLVVDSTGTLTVTGGTGAYAGVKGKGTMVCHTGDGIHTSCTDRLKIRQ